MIVNIIFLRNLRLTVLTFTPLFFFVLRDIKIPRLKQAVINASSLWSFASNFSDVSRLCLKLRGALILLRFFLNGSTVFKQCFDLK